MLGLSVGWGDEYDATDGGEGIDISSLPNGIYWLRGEVDPYHYFQESNTSNNVTDTKLKIEGDTVKVLEQTQPAVDAADRHAHQPESRKHDRRAPTTLSAEASGPSPITSVQFLLDGQPIGPPVTSPPYTLNWTPGSGVSGKHFLSAQVTDSSGLIGTAADVPVTIQETTGGGGAGKRRRISIVNPGAGQVVSGTVQVSATAHDEAAIRKGAVLPRRQTARRDRVTASRRRSAGTPTTASNATHRLTRCRRPTPRAGPATPRP